MNDFEDAAERAFKATAIAKGLDRAIKNQQKSRPSKKLLNDVREADIGAETGDEPGWFILAAKVKAITALVNIAKFTPTQVDHMLRFNPGTCNVLQKQYPDLFRLSFRESVDLVLDEFYRNKITVLENLMAGAPSTVKLLTEIQRDASRPLDLRLKAGDRIFDWTKMILLAKAPETTKKVLGDDLRTAADEADKTMGMLESNLMEALNGQDG